MRTAQDEAGLDGGEPYEDSVPISLVAHWSFCPRRAWLEAMGEKAPQVAQMAEGTAAHRRVDTPSAGEGDTVRAVDVRERTLGFHGRIDRAERLPSGALRVIEHKATPVKRSPTVSEANRLQLTLQTMALEAMGHEVAGAQVYFTHHHRNVPVDLDDADRSAAVAAVEATRKVVSSTRAPAPLSDDPKCMRCSHSSVCLPEERQEAAVVRRIVPPDPTGEVVHLTAPGSRASLSRGRLTVVQGDEKLASVPLERMTAVVVHGNVDLSGALLREMMWRGLPGVWCTGTGRVVGWTNGVRSPNGGARFRQFEVAAQGRVDVAREFIAAKISNQATILRRFGGDASVVAQLRSATRMALTAPTEQELFGIEGRAAAAYFDRFPRLLSDAVDSSIGANFPGRVGRGAVDELNVALNYGYGMLLGEVIRAVLACGLDPHAGLLHSPGRNKPALALDLMEEFRAPLVDAAVLTAFNNGEFGERSFTHVLGGARFTQHGRRKLISGVERRLVTEFMHPVFQYRMTWRRAIEVQARMFLGVLDGTQPTYKGIRVR
ncbi:CRISPR-associated endonuclease Cas4/Cas1 [Micrococcus lylae]|uniref:CRISPR-associated endonuclease Cas1 n=1 Tax=Micrococcus lylae TaxID=1273 RepID=A0ABY2JY98_9MICC|nr:CRISPR-associated endonuclease Cas4/Cas1 [Micrococcus lylae]